MTFPLESRWAELLPRIQTVTRLLIWLQWYYTNSQQREVNTLYIFKRPRPHVFGYFWKGSPEWSFWKRALSVFVWTDANAGFRIRWCHTSYSACLVRDAIDRISSFRDDWNTLHVDAYFSKTEKKKFRLDTCWRRLSLLQKIDCCITLHCCRRYTEKNYYITILAKPISRGVTDYTCTAGIIKFCIA